MPMRNVGYVLVIAAGTVALATLIHVASVEGVGLAPILCWLEVLCGGH
jgi:hypothetical protein